MPVSCSTSVLTGQDGALYFKPPGTEFCLLAADFGGVGGPVSGGVPSTIGSFSPVLPTTGAGYGAGPYNAIPTTTVTGSGTGLTLNVTVTASNVTAIVLGTAKGTGYMVGDTVKVLGTALGGTSPAKDITMTVTAASAIAGGSATHIAVPLGNDFAVGDPVTFVEELGASLDSALTVDTVYYVRAGGAKSPFIEVSATPGGSAITMLKDGDDAGGHIRVSFAQFQSVCQVRNFSLEISREELDITTLPCAGDAGASTGKYVQFKRYQGGFGDGSGSMTVLFTEDQGTVANRMLRSVLLRSQAGAAVQLFFNHVVDATGTADLDASSVLETPITLTSMSVSVDPDNPQEASINYRLSGQPTRMFGIVL